jgi:RND family efflux transporter MFP subunit
MSRLVPALSALVCVLSLLGLSGCDAEPQAKPAGKAQRPHLVELTPVSRDRLTHAADRVGSLRALNSVKIVNQSEGQLLEVRVREGDRVNAGQVLARYDDRIARAELDKALAARAQAEAEHDRAERLVAEGFLSQDAMTRAATARDTARAEVRLLEARLQQMTLTAPIDGVVSQRLVEPGDATAKHEHLLTLIDPHRLVTEVEVSELALPRLRVGNSARVRIDALGDTAHPGRILRIHPALDPATRNGRVEVVLEPLPPGARPGQFCRVTFTATEAEQFVIPLAALQRDKQGEFVYVFGDQDKVRRVSVRSGLRLADRVEILDGLSADARVVVKGFLELSDGRKVKPVGGAAAEAPAAAARAAQ